jgi:hypothetical protein
MHKQIPAAMLKFYKVKNSGAGIGHYIMLCALGMALVSMETKDDQACVMQCNSGVRLHEMYRAQVLRFK